MKANYKALFAAAILVLLVSSNDMGQEQPKAILVDEFGTIACGDLSARLDTFIAAIKEKPAYNGYIVISSNFRLAPRLAWREKFIDGYARYRGFKENRFILIRGKLPDQIQTQFWLALAGTQLPFEDKPESNFTLPPDVRKLKLYSDFEDGGPCYTRPPFRILSKYLKTSPGVNANIVIGAPSARSFSKAKEDINELFSKEYGIAPGRLRFFRGQSRYELVYELWLIRRKRK